MSMISTSGAIRFITVSADEVILQAEVRQERNSAPRRG
jgi:hypothetical protein